MHLVGNHQKVHSAASTLILEADCENTIGHGFARWVQYPVFHGAQLCHVSGPSPTLLEPVGAAKTPLMRYLCIVSTVPTGSGGDGKGPVAQRVQAPKKTEHFATL